MTNAKPYPREPERLAALKSLHLLDMPIEERFERITRMVCKALNVPIAIFNLIDENRQHYKSVQGLANTDAPLENAFCTHALHEPDMLLVPNALKDKRFFDNPFVTGVHLNIGFYAGCPIYTDSGMPVGTLCAIDTRPRDMTPEQLATLRDLAAMVEGELKAAVPASGKDLIQTMRAAEDEGLVDPLTRLWKRNGMMRIVDREWTEALRLGKPLTLALADIDHFKKINDTFGGAVGDNALKNVAKKLLQALRGEDVIGRFSGDRFLILLPDCPPDQAFETVDHIRKAIGREPMAIGQEKRGESTIFHSYPITMSFGAAAAFADNCKNSDVLLKRASEALDRVKHGDRNRTVLAS